MAALFESGWGVVALIGLAVLLFNVGLIYGLLSGSTQEQIEMMRRIAQRARNPWQPANKALDELHERVAGLSNSNAAPADEE